MAVNMLALMQGLPGQPAPAPSPLALPAQAQPDDEDAQAPAQVAATSPYAQPVTAAPAYVPPWQRPSSKDTKSSSNKSTMNVDKTSDQLNDELSTLQNTGAYKGQDDSIKQLQDMISLSAQHPTQDAGWVKPLLGLADAWGGPNSHLAADYQKPPEQGSPDQLIAYQKQLADMKANQFKQLMADTKDLKAGTTASQQNQQNLLMLGLMGKGGAAGDPDTKQLSDLQKQAMSFRGDAVSQQAGKDLYAAKKAQSLAALYPDVNKMPQAQVQLYATELAKMASGGVPTQEELKGLMPNTPTGSVEQALGKLKNEPTPANYKAFIDEYSRYTKALAADAQEKLDSRQRNLWDPWQAKFAGNPQYAALRNQFLPPAAPAAAPGNQDDLGADLTKMSPAQLQDWMKRHGGQ